ncbi:unnamed protein product, partial [Prorocentrum cordatum]
AARKAKAGAKGGASSASGFAPGASCFLGAGVSKASLCIPSEILDCIADQMKTEATVRKGVA